jgi:hypothetical protein
MRTTHRSNARPTRAAVMAALAVLALPALAHDYPTADRVTYVEECMQQHPGSKYEMLNKCSCTLDRIARDVTHDDFVNMSTAANATSIGGERGSIIRDTKQLQDQIKRFKALQIAAKKSCFINTDPQ